MNRNTVLYTLLTLILVVCPAILKAQGSNKVYTIDLSVLNEEETFAVLALQGLANREKPQIYVEPRKKGGFQGGGYMVQDVNVQRDGIIAITDDTKEKFPELEDVFKEHYKNKYNYNYQEVSFTELFNTFSKCYKGIVIYGGKSSPEGICIAATVAGQTDAIPVTENLRNKYPFFASAAVSENLITKDFSSRLDAHRWAMDTYLSKCSKDYMYSFWDAENNSYTIDYAIKNKLFSFNLSFANEKIHTDMDKVFPYSDEEAALFDRLCEYLNPGSIILGWGQPNEYILQARCGEKGHALICTNCSPNSSFHQAVPVSETTRKQVRQLTEDDVTLENKIYITFSINEGDTYKSLGNLMNDGAWLHQQRGSIPFNWPANPKVLDMLPALADYYYSTMTQNDYFYASTSGIGYFDATHSTPGQREVYASKSKEVIERNDMHYIDIWWNNFTDNDKWVASMGVEGYTTGTSREAVNFSKAIPIIESDMYYDLYLPPTKRKASNMALYIKEQSKTAISGKRPWFIHVYACDPAFASAVMENLDPALYKAVCMDEFFMLAKKAKSKLLLRSVPKNNTLIQQLIFETEAERFMEEFDSSSNWVNYFCTSAIENSQCEITGIGDMYYTQLVKNGNKYNLDKYPYFAARVTRFPSDKNVKWLLKMSDGPTTKVLPGEDKYYIGTDNIYLWNVKDITGWNGIKAANIQLVMEGTSNVQMQGVTMCYDWLHTYESIEQMNDELDLDSVHDIVESEDNRYIIRQTDGIIEVISGENISSLELINLLGITIEHSNNEQLNTGNIKPGVYLVKINNEVTRKIQIIKN